MINVDSITVTLGGKCILDSFSFAVASGEKVVLFGESGSGKSTLLKTLIGMHLPQNGTITIAGKPFSPENLSEYSFAKESYAFAILSIPCVIIVENSEPYSGIIRIGPRHLMPHM